MEVACNVACLRSVKSMPRISFWDSKQLALLNIREQDELRCIIDKMGILSAQAQHLRIPITDYNRLKSGSHSLYLCTSGIPGKPEFILVKGILKVGVKNLYIRKDDGQLVEIAPLCVLDFYVHENYQRLGLGHELFEAMCQREKKRPHELAIDRPSAKLHSFLAKYYNLTEFTPQSNQFVVFKDYFSEPKVHGDISKHTSRIGWSEEGNDLGSLLESSRGDKVLYGRRAQKSGLPDHDMPEVRKSTEELHIQRNDLSSPANSCTSRRQPLYGRRQSRQHQAKNCISDKVHNSPNLVEIPDQQSNSFLQNERETVKPRNIAIGQQMYPSHPSTKIGRGRRDVMSAQITPAESKKKNEKFHVRYGSPPSLPVRLEEPKEDVLYNPAKLPRRESTRLRLFHEDLTEPQSNPKQPPPLKYPYWTEDPQVFSRENYDKIGRNGSAPIPPSFQMTRSCYHAGMQGCGAAEAMGYFNRVVK